MINNTGRCSHFLASNWPLVGPSGGFSSQFNDFHQHIIVEEASVQFLCKLLGVSAQALSTRRSHNVHKACLRHKKSGLVDCFLFLYASGPGARLPEIYLRVCSDVLHVAVLLMLLRIAGILSKRLLVILAAIPACYSPTVSQPQENNYKNPPLWPSKVFHGYSKPR